MDTLVFTGPLWASPDGPPPCQTHIVKPSRSSSAALFAAVVGGISLAAGVFGASVPQLEIPSTASQVLSGEGVACIVLAVAMLLPSRAAALLAFLLYAAVTLHLWRQGNFPTLGLGIRCGLALMLLRSFNEIRDVVRVRRLQSENDRKIAEDGMRYRQATSASAASPTAVPRRDPTKKHTRSRDGDGYGVPEPTPEKARTAKLGPGMKPRGDRRMTCPNCQQSFSGSVTMCPQCSVRLYAD